MNINQLRAQAAMSFGRTSNRGGKLILVNQAPSAPIDKPKKVKKLSGSSYFNKVVHSAKLPGRQ